MHFVLGSRSGRVALLPWPGHLLLTLHVTLGGVTLFSRAGVAATSSETVAVVDATLGVAADGRGHVRSHLCDGCCRG